MAEETKTDEQNHAASCPNERMVRLAAAITSFGVSAVKARIEIEKLVNMYPKEHFDKAARLAECTPRDIFHWIDMDEDSLDMALARYGA